MKSSRAVGIVLTISTGSLAKELHCGRQSCTARADVVEIRTPFTLDLSKMHGHPHAKKVPAWPRGCEHFWLVIYTAATHITHM